MQQCPASGPDRLQRGHSPHRHLLLNCGCNLVVGGIDCPIIAQCMEQFWAGWEQQLPFHVLCCWFLFIAV
eukprot:378993-Pyramimonas_sp.AAC.1